MVSVEAKPLARPTMAVNSHVVRGAMVKWTVVLTGAMVGRGAAKNYIHVLVILSGERFACTSPRPLDTEIEMEKESNNLGCGAPMPSGK